MLKLKYDIVEYKWFDTLFLIFILILTFVSFSRVTGFEFLDWDDYMYIVNNPLITEISWENFRQMFYHERHISLVLLSFSIEYYFFGLEPWIYHLINLLLHLLNVILIYFLSKQLKLNTLGIFVTVVLFALHPMRVETVSWVMQRKDLLFTFLLLLGLLLYINYIKHKERNLLLILLVFIMGYLSFLSKIQAIIFPVLLILLDVFFRIKFNYKNIFEKIFLLVIFIIGQFDLAGWMCLIAIFSFIFFQHYYNISKRFPFFKKREEPSPVLLNFKQLCIRYCVLFIIGLIFFFITLFTDIKYLKISYIFIFIYLFLLLVDKYRKFIKIRVYIWRGFLLILFLSGLILIFILFYNKTIIPLFSLIEASDFSILQRLILSSFSSLSSSAE